MLFSRRGNCAFQAIVLNHPGMRVFPRIEGTCACVRGRLGAFPTAILSDNMSRAFGTSRLIAVHGKRAFVGNALTIRTRPGDNLMIHRAMDMLQAGDVLVVDGAGALDNALVGELIMLMAIEKGATGFVIDGAVRDVAAFRTAEFPCYARGISHRGPYKDGPGEVNVPVAIDGMVVRPGDIIVGDEDGVVAISPEDSEKVCAGAFQQINKEEDIKARIRTHSYHREWLEPLLRQKGIET